MTLPDERTHALLSLLSLAKDLLDPKKTPKVPKYVRQRALRALRHAPSVYHIKSIVDALPNDYADIPALHRLLDE